MRGQKKTPAIRDWLAAEIEEQGGYQNRLKRFAAAIECNQNVLAELRKGKSKLTGGTIKGLHDKGQNLIKAISDCGSWLVFRHFVQVDVHRLIKGNLCKKHLLCQLCAMRRSALQVRAHEEKVKTVFHENPDQVPLLFTATVKNGWDLNERFSHIENALGRLIQKRRSAISHDRDNTVMRHVLGGTGSFEVKRGDIKKEWHPHLHMLLLVPKGQLTFVQKERKTTRHGKKTKKMVWVPLEFERALRAEWMALTGDSHMLDVRRIEFENDADRIGSLCEVFKYALKLNDMDPFDQVHAAAVLSGRRLQRSFGNLFGVEINEELSDIVEKELELQPYIDLVLNYNDGQYSFVEYRDYGDLKPPENVRTKRNTKMHGKMGPNTQGLTQEYMNSWLQEQRDLVNAQVPF